jgi:uncharacterized protein (DUF58 family)
VSRSALPKLQAYAALTTAGLVAAIALGRPELVSLAAPFALFLSVGLTRLPSPDLTVEVSLDREKAVEGEEIELVVSLRARATVERLEVVPRLPQGLELDECAPLSALRLRVGERRRLPLRVGCRRWGAYRLGALELRAFDRFGLVVDEAELEPALTLRVYPAAERLRQLLRPAETQPFAGNQVARAKGDGIEFADIRPFTRGDRVRRINWRATARRQVLHVNESHPERNADVVLFLDSFAEARRADASTLDRAVRAAAALAHAYLQRRDRVGLVRFGGTVRWLTPASGSTQLHRIVDALLETEIVFSYAWKGIDVLPRGTLPPQSLVLALTPLLDDRSINALLDLRGRGFDLAIIDMSPVAYANRSEGELADLAFRAWRLWREALLYRYERLGVPVVEWQEGKPLAAALGEVSSFRRYVRAARS